MRPKGTSLGGTAGDQSKWRREETQEDAFWRIDDTGAEAEPAGTDVEPEEDPETHPGALIGYLQGCRSWPASLE